MPAKDTEVEAGQLIGRVGSLIEVNDLMGKRIIDGPHCHYDIQNKSYATYVSDHEPDPRGQRPDPRTYTNYGGLEVLVGVNADGGYTTAQVIMSEADWANTTITKICDANRILLSSATSETSAIFGTGGDLMGFKTVTMFSDGLRREVYADLRGNETRSVRISGGVRLESRNGLSMTYTTTPYARVPGVDGDQVINSDGSITVRNANGVELGTITFNTEDSGGGTLQIGSQAFSFGASDFLNVNAQGTLSQGWIDADGRSVQHVFSPDGSFIENRWDRYDNYLGTTSSTVGTSGPITNSFEFIFNPSPASGDGQNSGASDPNATANQVREGLVGTGGGWTVTTDPDLLNNDQAVGGVTDNTAAAAWTQILAGDVRPGNANVAESVLVTELTDKFAADPSDPGSGAWDPALTAAALNLLDARAQTTAPTDPLVLDLNGDGVKLTAYLSDPVLFDADHDGGALEQTGWVSKEDGLVVYDLNDNGQIDNMSEVLSEYFNGTVGTGGTAGTKPFANGLAALASLDSNSDGAFTSTDAAWNSVRVWVDANHDGKSFLDANGNGVFDTGEVSELKTLAELGITRINLTGTTQSGLVRDGNEVLATATFVQNVDAAGQGVPVGTPGSTTVTREALAANFLANPNGSTFTQIGSGLIASTQGSGTVAATSAYLSTSTTGETIDLAALGVRNAAGGSGDDTLLGDGNNNWLAGGLGSDTFDAGAGDDVLLIDAADEQANIHGGTGTDTVQVIGDAGVTLNLAAAEIEIAQGGRGDDILIGGGRSSIFVRGGIRDVASFIAFWYSPPRDAAPSPPGRPGHPAPCDGAGDRADGHLPG